MNDCSQTLRAVILYQGAYMARFCIKCGKELGKGDSFCQECGTKVDESYYADVPTQVMPQAGVNDEAVSSSQNPGGVSAPTTPMTPVSSGGRPAASVASFQQPAPASSQPSGGNGTNKGIAIGVLSAFVVVLFVLVILFATGAVSLGGNQGSSDTTKTAQSDASSTAKESDESDSSTGEHKSSDEHNASADSSQKSNELGKADVHVSSQEIELYGNLKDSYKKLGNLSDEINTTYKNAFNNNAMKKDRSKRTVLRNNALDEYDKVNAAMEDLKTLESAAYGSDYNASTYEDMLSCYEYCLHRIGVICDAWENSLYYDEPKGHEDEICAPLKDAQYDENGKKHKGNVDLERYKALYPKCKPVNPEKN